MTVAFRLTIYEADGTTPDLTFTTLRTGTNPYITGVPSGDGQEVDLLTGAVRSGAYVVEVADVATGTDTTGTIRIITNSLEDSSFRQQLLSRRAKLECSRDNGSTWAIWTFGYLTSLRQTDAITYAFTVSDSRRIEATHTAFTWSSNPNAATDEQREFPNRGCLAGGPTLESFGPMRATGGWEYAWQEVQGRIAALNFIAAYNPPSWARNNTIEVIPYFNALRPFLQTLPPIANVTGANFAQLRDRQYVYGSTSVQAIITAGASKWTGTVRGAHTPPSPAQNGQGAATVPRFGDMNFLYIDLDPGQSTSYPTANTVIRVQLIQKKISEISPLYIAEHPVDIVTKLYQTVNIPFNAASATSVKALIGDDLKLALRITGPILLGKFLSESIFGPFGFSARTNASGEQEFFTTRIARSATPTISITDADIVGDTPPPIFEVDETSVVTSFRLTTKALTPFIADTTGGTQTPPDGITETETTQIVENGDLSTFSTREVAYTFPGMLYDSSASSTAFTLSPEVVGSFFTGIVAEGFDRFGRGATASEVQVLASSNAASLQVGDEVLIAAGYYPNKNYRIGESSVGSRIAQIVRRTEAPEGPIFKLIDSGVNAQPTAPTFTVAADAGDPRRVAAVTVTNAGTLNSAGVTLAVQYQVSANTPTKTGTLYTRFRPGTIPTVAFTLPAVLPGSKVWVRMRTERTEYRASAWTAWTSVTLDAWVAPTGLTVGTTTANSVALSWSLGSPTANTIDPLDVFAYKGASAPADWTPYRVGSLASGSTSTTIRNLDASTQYTFGVAFKDEASGGYSTFATATTTTAATNTVSAPAAPKMRVYTSFPNAGQSTGVALAIGAVEGYNIVVQRAPDSSGSPGTWADIALLAPLTPIFVDPLPSDGVTRWYRVFYRLSGFLDGSAGPARSATPIAIPDDLMGQNSSIISGGASLTFGSYLVGTPDNFYDGATSQSLAVDATSASTANKVVARDNTGSFSANTITATLNGPAPAGQLTGDTLAANVTTSSLTSVGTIGTGTWQGTSVGKNYGGTGLTSTAFTGITNERVFAYDGGSGSFFIAPSGSNGQALVYSGGALAWGNPAPGSHVLADTTGLGSQHTTSGLTAGMILQATGATTARFQTPSIPASSVTAGTFSGASYTITNDLTVSGTLTGTLTGNITGNAATVTNGVYTTGSYADPSWITSLAGSKISGNISGSAANVTGTVAIANGGTNATSYGTSGSGTRAIVYDIGTNAFEAVAAGTSGQFLQSAGNAGDITWATPPNFNSTTAGYAPASGGGTTNFLRADGTWAAPSVGSVSANNVTAGTFSGANYYFTNNVRFDSGARVAFGYGYTIDNAGGSPVSVLTATTLGSGVVNSSLTSVGTLTSGALGAGFTAIDNARLANSSIIINGTSVSLGGSITVDTSKWTASGSNIYYSTGNVSIGTTPSSSIELLVRGGGTSASTYSLFTENSSATSTFWVNDAGNVSIPNGNLGIGGSPNSNRLAVNGTTQTVSLGVNTSSPSESVEVSGRVYINGEGNGVIVDTGSKRVGFMKYPGHEGVIARVSGIKFGIVRLSSSDIANPGTITYDVYVDPNGNVGIGAVPAVRLDVAGGNIRTTNGYAFAGNASNPGDNAALFYDQSGIGPTINGLNFTVRTGSTTTSEAFRVASTGYVGIGTTPIRGLHLAGTSALAEFILENTAMPADNRKFNLWGEPGVGTSGRFYFRLLNDAGNAATREFLAFDNATGNVGVGVRAPAYKLDVDGTIQTRSGGVRFPDGTTQTTAATASQWTTSGSNIYYNTGNVGIGTSSPQMPLQVSGGSAGTGGWNRTALLSATFPVLVFESTYTPKFAGIGYDSSSAMRFWVNASSNDVMATSAVMSILNNGSVGIGTTSPSVKLHIVDGGIRAQGSGSQIDTSPSGGAFRFYDGSTFYGGLGMAGWAGLSAPSSDIVMYLSGVNYHITSGTTTRLYIENSTGNVGIGTTSPATGLHVKSSGSYGTITSDTSTSTGGGAFGIRKNGSVIGYLINKGAWFGDTSNDLCIAAESGYNFRIYTGGTIGEKFIVTTTGNVGIGVSSPSYKLHVRDDIIAVDTTTSTSLTGFYAKWSGGDTGIRMTYRPNDALCFIDSTYPRTAGTVYGDIDIRQNVAGTQTSRLYIKNDNGNVGIGTTSPAFKLDTWDAGAVISGTATIGSNMRGVRIYNTTTATTNNAVGLWFSTGPHQAGIASFRASAESTWETTLAFYTHVDTTSALNDATEKMRLTGNGNLGVNTNAPSERIHVVGNVFANGEGNGFIVDASTNKRVGLMKYAGIEGALVHGNACPLRFGRVNQSDVTGGTFTEEMAISTGGDVYVNGTGWAGSRFTVNESSGPTAEINGTSNTANQSPLYVWNNVESGSTYFISFYSDGQNNPRELRGYINYRRDNATMNLTTASDYRIKTIHGAYTKSGEVFDKIQVHEGTINGESGKYPMVLAHELQEAYSPAVEGEKDAVNEDGTPKLQMVSYVAMIPVMLAEIKSLRERVAQLEKQ